MTTDWLKPHRMSVPVTADVFARLPRAPRVYSTDPAAQKSRRRRQQRKDANLCIDCGTAPPTNGRMRCDFCSAVLAVSRATREPRAPSRRTCKVCLATTLEWPCALCGFGVDGDPFGDPTLAISPPLDLNSHGMLPEAATTHSYAELVPSGKEPAPSSERRRDPKITLEHAHIRAVLRERREKVKRHLVGQRLASRAASGDFSGPWLADLYFAMGNIPNRHHDAGVKVGLLGGGTMEPAPPPDTERDRKLARRRDKFGLIADEEEVPR